MSQGGLPVDGGNFPLGLELCPADGDPLYRRGASPRPTLSRADRYHSGFYYFGVQVTDASGHILVTNQDGDHSDERNLPSWGWNCPPNTLPHGPLLGQSRTRNRSTDPGAREERPRTPTSVVAEGPYQMG